MQPGNQGQVSGPSVPPDGDLLGEIYSFVSKWTGLEDICLKCGCFTEFVLICVLTLCPRKQEDLSVRSLCTKFCQLWFRKRTKWSRVTKFLLSIPVGLCSWDCCILSSEALQHPHFHIPSYFYHHCTCVSLHISTPLCKMAEYLHTMCIHPFVHFVKYRLFIA